ncbi:hypothetical protein [Streptomyces sp. NPDC046942]|uniref:hypothetical protein n=1 Tax=Streptomyces sp. NPDC046942 TaxID=3155137 RepID=UPI0033EAAFD9
MRTMPSDEAREPDHQGSSMGSETRRSLMTKPLVTDFGADPELVAQPVMPGSASDIGERMILAPHALDPELDNEPPAAGLPRRGRS